MVSCRHWPTAKYTCTHQKHVCQTANVIVRGCSITGLLACSSVTRHTVNRISGCENCRHYKHRGPQLCRYGCLCFDPTTTAYRDSSRASHYILQQLPTSHITLGKAGSESKRYLLKPLEKTASLRGSILKDAFRLRRFAVGCPHSIHSFNRFELKSAPGCQPSSSASSLPQASCTVCALWLTFCTLQHLLAPGIALMLPQRACSSSRESFALSQSTVLGTGGLKLKGRNSFLGVQYFGFQEMYASEPAPPDLRSV